MRKDDIDALGRLGGLLVEEVAGWVEQQHKAVAARAFGWAGPVAGPVRLAHDAVADGTYRSVRALGRAAGHAAGSAFGPMADGVPLSASPAGGQAVASVDAVLGDRLEAQGNPLALPMVLRSRQADVPVERDALAAAFPDATGRVVVLVHGLGETDLSWLGRDEAGRPWSYAHALETTGWTGAAVRYNTGRRIVANGRSLATLLDGLVASWPNPVVDLALVGHSMGGLVIRSACNQGVEAGQAWPALVRSCVYLGSPHHGAPLEQAASALAWLLGHIPETGAVARALHLRSAGIQDLRVGALAVDDEGRPDRPAPGLLPSARHHLVAGDLGSAGWGPASMLLGDLMVRPGSALGLGNRRVAALEPCERATFPGVNHYALLKDRGVADALVGWLG